MTATLLMALACSCLCAQQAPFVPNSRTFKSGGTAPGTVFRERTTAANESALDTNDPLYSAVSDGRRLGLARCRLPECADGGHPT